MDRSQLGRAQPREPKAGMIREWLRAASPIIAAIIRVVFDNQ